MSEPAVAQGKQVIVVGGGLAGLCAAIEAARKGADVTILEKEKSVGGNSNKASSGINAVKTQLQQSKGIDDSIGRFVEDTLRSGDGLCNDSLVCVLAKQSADSIAWLETFGLKFDSLVQLGGHQAARTHRFLPTPDGKPVPVGFTIMSALRKYIETELKDKVEVKTQCSFQTLVIEDGSVIGLTFLDAEGNSHSLSGTVVLCSGGYANDHTNTSLLQKYTPHLASLPTTNGPWATGDVIKATADANLLLTLMDKVQVHPTGFVLPSNPQESTKFLAPEALRGCGAILLDAGGRRFVNELGRRDHLVKCLFEHCTPFKAHPDYPLGAMMLMSGAVLDLFGRASVGFYEFKGLMRSMPNLDAVAAELGIDVSELRATLAQYRVDAEAGHDAFGKSVFPVVFNDDDPFYISYITPTLHYCMGGIAIDANAAVLRDGPEGPAVIPGLFAAGEQSGGLHGENRLGGNSLMECVVFGRIAGQHAAQ